MPLDADCSVALEVGATSAGDGGAETLVVTGLDDDADGLVELSGADVAGLCVADVTGAGVLDGASRDAGGAALVAVDDDGACRVDVAVEAGADDAGSGELVCVGVSTAGSGARVADGASTVCCAVGAVTDDGATVDGTSATVDFSTGACVVASTVGCGTTVVVGATGGEPGSANAGATPPVSAVRDITTPDARTAQTVRLRQISNGARIVHRLLHSSSPPTPV